MAHHSPDSYRTIRAIAYLFLYLDNLKDNELQKPASSDNPPMTTCEQHDKSASPQISPTKESTQPRHFLPHHQARAATIPRLFHLHHSLSRLAVSLRISKKLEFVASPSRHHGQRKGPRHRRVGPFRGRVSAIPAAPGIPLSTDTYDLTK